MTSEHPMSPVMPILSNEGLQPILSNTVTPHQHKKVPVTLFRETPKTILVDQSISSPPNPSSPLAQIRTPPISNKRYIIVSDSEDSNKSKLPKLEELSDVKIEDLRKQIVEEEAKLQLMLQLQSQNIVTTQTPHITFSAPYMSSPPHKMKSKPTIIHAANEINKNALKSAILINPDNHAKHSNILISRAGTDLSKQTRMETKPTIIHGTLHTDKMHQSTLPLVGETLSPNGLDADDFKELQELQVKVRNIAQKFLITLPTAKHPNLFLSKHNHPKKHLNKMIERTLIKAQLPPTNREVWPIIPFADNNFQFAVGLEEAVLYVTGETENFSARNKKSRVVCQTCGNDFGSGWHRSKSACYCEACASSQQIKEHRNSLVAHLNGLIRDVESDERDFDRFSELLAKQQAVLQQTQQQQQQQQQPESFIVSQYSDGQFNMSGNSITFSNSRINPATVIHQKQDVQYVAINQSDGNAKLQPIAGYFIQQNTPDKNKNGQASKVQIRNVMYAPVEQKTVANAATK